MTGAVGMRIRPAAVAAALTAGAVLLTGCSAGDSGGHSATVRALWFGDDANGSLVSGVTPLTINERTREVPAPFEVNLDGLTSAGAGAMWTSASATAAVVATLASGRDPRTLDTSFTLTESIDGPSAGALTTAGVFAAINGAKVRKTASMTGTILPDGGVGAVGGIPEKIRAAAANGINEVSIPAGDSTLRDPRTGEMVDVVELGRQLDVTVREARTVWDAYPQLTGQAATSGRPEAQPQSPAPAFTAVISKSARAAMNRTRSQLARLPAGQADSEGTTTAELKQLVSTELDHASAQLAGEQEFAAYTTATASEQQVGMWQADVTTTAALRTRGVPATRSGLIERARTQEKEARAQLASTASAPVSTIEQIAELPYLLGRDIAVIGTDEVALAELRDPASGTLPQDLRQVAVTLVPAQYHTEHVVPELTAALLATPGTAPADPRQLSDFLAGYADFMGYAGDANLEYLESLTGSDSADSSGFNNRLASIDRAEWAALAAAPADSAAVRVRLAWALHYFLTSTVLVAEIGAIDPGERWDSAQLNSIQILDADRFSGQVSGADEIARTQDRLLAGAKLDSSMLQFINDWGRGLATDPEIKVSDARRRLGLEFQWNATVLGFLLLAADGAGGRSGAD